MSSRAAFTLIELLVVIAIIAALAGMIMGALAVANRQKRNAMQMQQIQELSIAVNGYLSDYPTLGPSPAAFSAQPYHYLVRQAATAKGAYIDIPRRLLCAGSPPQPADPAKATGILDTFGQALVWTVSNGSGLGGRAFTEQVEILSTWGTPDDISDDRGYRWTSKGDGWAWRQP